MVERKKARLYTANDARIVTDNPTWTAADIAAAKSIDEVLPNLAQALRRGRGPAKKLTKERVTLRIDRDTLAIFRATGEGWQTRINDTLAKSAARLKRNPL